MMPTKRSVRARLASTMLKGVFRSFRGSRKIEMSTKILETVVTTNKMAKTMADCQLSQVGGGNPVQLDGVNILK